MTSLAPPRLNPVIPSAVERIYNLTIRSVQVASGGFSSVSVFRATTIDGRELAIRRTPEIDCSASSATAATVLFAARDFSDRLQADPRAVSASSGFQHDQWFGRKVVFV